MGLFKPEVFRAFAIGFAIGLAGVVSIAGGHGHGGLVAEARATAPLAPQTLR